MNLVVHLPAAYSLSHPMGGEAAEQAFTHRIEETESGRYQIVTFGGMPEHIEVALQVIGGSVRMPGSWATADGRRMSSLEAWGNRSDCYRQSLAVADR